VAKDDNKKGEGTQCLWVAAALFCVELEGAEVGDGDGATFDGDETGVLQAREGARDDIADRADAGGDLMVGQDEPKGRRARQGSAGKLGLVEKKKSDALADLVEGEKLDHLGVSTHAGGHELERLEDEGGVIAAELAHLLLADEESIGVLFGDGGGRVGAVVEDGDLGHDGAGGVDVHDVLASFFVVLKGAHLAVDDDEEAFGFFAGEEEHLPPGEVDLDGLPGQLRKLFRAEFAEEHGVFEGGDFIGFH